MLNELHVEELLAEIGDAGSATALTGALAAALAERSARCVGDEVDAARAHELAFELVRLGGEETSPEEIADRADEVVALALRASDKLSSADCGDAEAAAELARACARVAHGLARLKLSSS